jgi:hypothetical protein
MVQKIDFRMGHVQEMKNALTPAIKYLGGLGRENTAANSVEEKHPQLFFEKGHVRADSRLG